MLKVRQPVVVEGRYDRIRLSSVIDGIVIETGGFRIFRDRELLSALRSLARTIGLVILTDSDEAGFRIRHFLTGALGPDARLKQVYIPGIAGVERRKRSPSAEGLLGVEGMERQVLLEAFARAGVGCETVPRRSDLSLSDLYAVRLSGAPDSAIRRRALLARLSLPARLSTKTTLALLNTLLTREEFFALAASINSPEKGEPACD